MKERTWRNQVLETPPCAGLQKPKTGFLMEGGGTGSVHRTAPFRGSSHLFILNLTVTGFDPYAWVKWQRLGYPKQSVSMP